jgi:hypothetical protein
VAQEGFPEEVMSKFWNARETEGIAGKFMDCRAAMQRYWEDWRSQYSGSE